MFNSTYNGRSWFFLYGLTLIKDWVVTNWNCHSLLNFSKEATQDILAALQVDAEEVTRSILSLKDKARKLICEWLQQHCRASLSTILSTNPIPCQHDCLKEAFQISGVLMKTDYRDPRWHLLHIDSLLARGEVCSIFTYNNFSIKFQVQTNKRHQFCWWLKAFVCVFVNVFRGLEGSWYTPPSGLWSGASWRSSPGQMGSGGELEKELQISSEVLECGVWERSLIARLPPDSHSASA